jgi:hypothetical protein
MIFEVIKFDFFLIKKFSMCGLCTAFTFEDCVWHFLGLQIPL